MLRVGGLIPYSQNFISDPNLVRRLLKQSGISISDTVLDIGAGKGLLTKELINFSNKVVAIEIDPNLFRILKSSVECKSVTLINKDFLEVQLPKEDYKVFANIPFNYTSRIMNKLYFQGNSPSAAYIILQKEASNMYLGVPRETQKSLLLKPFFTINVYYKFTRTDFFPVPNVDIEMLCINKREQSLIKQDFMNEYWDFVVYGTTQYKTTLKKSLSKIYTHEQFKRLSKSINFSMEAKPLDLSTKQWIELFNYYQQGVIETKKQLVRGSYIKQKVEQKKLKKVYRTRKHGNSTPHHL